MGWFGKKKREPKGVPVVLSVEGMTCANCVRHVREALQGVEGVHQAEVDLRKNEAWVDMDPARARVDAMVAAVKAVGYAAHPAGSD